MSRRVKPMSYNLNYHFQIIHEVANRKGSSLLYFPPSNKFNTENYGNKKESRGKYFHVKQFAFFNCLN